MKKTKRIYIVITALILMMIFSGCGKNKKSEKDKETYVNKDGVTVTLIKGDGKIADQMSEAYAAVWNGFAAAPPVRAEAYICAAEYGEELRAIFTDAETIASLYETVAGVKLTGKTNLAIEDAGYTGVTFFAADGQSIYVLFEAGYLCMENTFYEYEGSKTPITVLVNENGAYWSGDAGDFERSVKVEAGDAEIILYLKGQTVVGVSFRNELARDLIYHGALFGESCDDAYELIVQEARDRGYLDGSEPSMTEIR